LRIKVVGMDVSCPEHIKNLEGYDSLDILFRSCRDPIRRVSIPCRTNTVEKEEVQTLINNLTIPPPSDSSNKNLPSLTVVICTRNRPDAFANSLKSITRQKHPPDEVIVIDNGSQEEIHALTQEILPNAKYFIERRPGLDFARNHALMASNGDIVAFLDDDAQADSFWALSIKECFAAFPEAGAVTGLILPLELETHAQQMFEANGGFGRGFTRRVLPDDSRKKYDLKSPLIAESIGVGSGCNMAFKTSVLKDIGGFDEALDTGPPLPGGGDLDAFYRVLRAGLKLVYEPRAMVHHQHRQTIPELNHQLSGHYRSLSAFLVKTIFCEKGWSRVAAAFFLAWRIIKLGYRLIRRLFSLDVLPLKVIFGIFFGSIVGLGSYQASKFRNRNYASVFGENIKQTSSFQFLELWRYRELIWMLAIRDLKVKYKRSWLGFIWTLLNPLITVGVLIAIFSYVVRIPIKNYWAFLISGYFVFNFFSMSVNGGVQSALGNAYLSRSAYFPQEILVISSALARFIEFLGELSVVVVVLVIFHHKSIPGSFVMLFPLLPLLFIFTIGITFPLVTLAIYFSDAIQIIPLLTFVLFYLSPVFYNIELIPENFRNFYYLNPMAIILNMTHSILYWGKIPDTKIFLITSLLSLITGITGYIIFNRKKRIFPEIV
jgi:ABC-type polysaccharide/polyol phosphate export permease/GT2 family glycosyltransferase